MVKRPWKVSSHPSKSLKRTAPSAAQGRPDPPDPDLGQDLLFREEDDYYD